MRGCGSWPLLLCSCTWKYPFLATRMHTEKKWPQPKTNDSQPDNSTTQQNLVQREVARNRNGTWNTNKQQSLSCVLALFFFFVVLLLFDDSLTPLVSSPSKTGNCDNRVIVHFVLSLYFKQILDSASVSAATTTRAVLVFVFCLSPLFNCFGNCNRSWQVTARLV